MTPKIKLVLQGLNLNNTEFNLVELLLSEGAEDKALGTGILIQQIKYHGMDQERLLYIFTKLREVYAGVYPGPGHYAEKKRIKAIYYRINNTKRKKIEMRMPL